MVVYHSGCRASRDISEGLRGVLPRSHLRLMHDVFGFLEHTEKLLWCVCSFSRWDVNPVCSNEDLVISSFRLEQADLTLVVVDCAQLPSSAPEAAEFLKRHLKSVLSLQEPPETGTTNISMHRLQRELRNSESRPRDTRVFPDRPVFPLSRQSSPGAEQGRPAASRSEAGPGQGAGPGSWTPSSLSHLLSH